MEIQISILVAILVFAGIFVIGLGVRGKHPIKQWRELNLKQRALVVLGFILVFAGMESLKAFHVSLNPFLGGLFIGMLIVGCLATIVSLLKREKAAYVWFSLVLLSFLLVGLLVALVFSLMGLTNTPFQGGIFIIF